MFDSLFFEVDQTLGADCFANAFAGFAWVDTDDIQLSDGVLINEVGPGGRVTLIESDENAITDARRSFASVENVEIVQARVEKALKDYRAANVVVLDPPRAGAGAAVISAIAKLKPRNIVYVACDPAALARDTAYLRDAGFKLNSLRAFDLFPMTAHMECVARFMPA